MLPLKTTSILTAIAGLTLAGSANAETIVYDVERWEVDGEYGIWENATNQYRSNGLGAGNILWDQQPGSDIPLEGFGASTDAIRIRSSTGSMVLKDPLPLATLGALSVTIQYDLREMRPGYTSSVQYSSDGEFQFDDDGDDTVTLASYDGNGTVDGTGVTDPTTWVRYSHTITTGLTDTFQFRLGKPSRSDGSNPTFHAWDNIVISIETAPSEPFAITEIIHDSDTDVVTLSWNADAGTQYTVFYARNPDKLQAGEFGDGDAGDSFEDNDMGDANLDPEEGKITVEFANPDPGVPDLFFSVHKN